MGMWFNIFTPSEYTLENYFLPKLKNCPWLHLAVYKEGVTIEERMGRTDEEIKKDWMKLSRPADPNSTSRIMNKDYPAQSVSFDFGGSYETRDLLDGKDLDIFDPENDEKLRAYIENKKTVAYYSLRYSSKGCELANKVVIEICDDKKIWLDDGFGWEEFASEFIKVLRRHEN
jgi:hypothetical protein